MNDTVSPKASVDVDIQDLAKRAWSLFLRRPVFHVLAFLIVATCGTLTLGLAFAPLFVGYVRIIDRCNRDEEVELGEIFEGLRNFGAAFLVGFLFAVTVAVASLLVVLPGIIVAFVWSYALWFVALERKSPPEALRASYTLARDNVGTLLLVMLPVVALNIAGSLLVLGVLVTAPLGTILMTLGFLDLTGSGRLNDPTKLGDDT
ncbi:MAG: hypothetical protein V3T05_03750 [Myxococcota bacterium]